MVSIKAMAVGKTSRSKVRAAMKMCLRRRGEREGRREGGREGGKGVGVSFLLPQSQEARMVLKEEKGTEKSCYRKWEGRREGGKEGGREGGRKGGQHVRKGIVCHGVSPHEGPKDAVQNHARQTSRNDL